MLAVFAGAILIVDLRLMGRALTERPVAEVAKDAQPWMVAGLIALTITGIPQMMSNAIREYLQHFLLDQDGHAAAGHHLYVYPSPARHAGR